MSSVVWSEAEREVRMAAFARNTRSWVIERDRHARWREVLGDQLRDLLSAELPADDIRRRCVRSSKDRWSGDQREAVGELIDALLAPRAAGEGERERDACA